MSCSVRTIRLWDQSYKGCLNPPELHTSPMIHSPKLQISAMVPPQIHRQMMQLHCIINHGQMMILHCISIFTPFANGFPAPAPEGELPFRVAQTDPASYPIVFYARVCWVCGAHFIQRCRIKHAQDWTNLSPIA